MQEFYFNSTTDRPRILGLTASPLLAGTKVLKIESKVITLLTTLQQNLDCKLVSSSDYPDAISFTAQPVDEFFYFSLDTDASSRQIQTFNCLLKNCPSKTKIEPKILNFLEYCLPSLGSWCTLNFILDFKKNYVQRWSSADTAYIASMVDFLLSICGENTRCPTCPLKKEHLSKKVTELLAKILEIRKLEGSTLCCIIFVQRRWTAILLSNIINAMFSNNAEFGLKSNFITGYASFKISEEELYQRKMKTAKILGNFRQGKINVLLATSIVEEGLDVPTCNCIIQFDSVQTVKSNIQRRGRARCINGRYIILMPAPANDSVEYEQYLSLQRCEKLIRSSIIGNEILESIFLQASLLESRELLVIEETGALVSMQSAIGLVYQYCSTLPVDRYCTRNNLMPTFKEHLSPDMLVYRYSCLMPSYCPINEEITGSWSPSKQIAKQSVCLLVCGRLHELGCLDDNLINPSCEHLLPKEFFSEVNTLSSSQVCLKVLPLSRQSIKHDSVPDSGMEMYLYECVNSYEENVLLGILSRTSLSLESPEFPFLCNDFVAHNLKLRFLGVVIYSLAELTEIEFFFEILLSSVSTIYVSQCLFVKKNISSISAVPLKKKALDQTDLVIDWEELRRVVLDAKTIESETLAVIYRRDGGEAMRDKALNRVLFKKIFLEKNIFRQQKIEVLDVLINTDLRCVQIPFEKATPNYELTRFSSATITATEVSSGNTASEKLSVKELDIWLGKYYKNSRKVTEVRRYDIIQDERGRFKSVLHFWEDFPGEKKIFDANLDTFKSKQEAKHAIANHVLAYLKKSNLSQHSCFVDMLTDIATPMGMTVTGSGLDPNLVQQRFLTLFDYFREKTPLLLDKLGKRQPIIIFKFAGRNMHQVLPIATRNVSFYSAKKQSDVYHVRFTRTAIHNDDIYLQVNKLDDIYHHVALPVANERNVGICVHPISLNLSRAASPLGLLIYHCEQLRILEEFKVTLLPTFRDTSLLLCALTAPSALLNYSYERLETLGDSVLKILATIHVTVKYPNYYEGQLTVTRSNIICNNNLMQHAMVPKINLVKYILKDPYAAKKFMHFSGEEKMDEDEKEISIKTVADVFEAIIGAFYIDCQKDLKLVWNAIFIGFGLVNATNHYPDCIFIPNASLSTIPYDIDIKTIENILQYCFNHPSLILEALTHASFIPESLTYSFCYQRLEFLGDAVLDFVVTCFLYNFKPELNPGTITEWRSFCVCNSFLGIVAVQTTPPLCDFLRFNSADLKDDIGKFKTEARQFLLEEHEHLTKTKSFISSEEREVDAIKSHQQLLSRMRKLEPPKVLGDLVEALLGALFSDCNGSFEKVTIIINTLIIDRWLKPFILSAERSRLHGYTDNLQHPFVILTHALDSVGCRDITIDFTKTTSQGIPNDIEDDDDTLPIHSVVYDCSIVVHEKTIGRALGNTKKNAKKKAAENFIGVNLYETCFQLLSDLCTCGAQTMVT